MESRKKGERERERGSGLSKDAIFKKKISRCFLSANVSSSKTSGLKTRTSKNKRPMTHISHMRKKQTSESVY